MKYNIKFKIAGVTLKTVVTAESKLQAMTFLRGALQIIDCEEIRTDDKFINDFFNVLKGKK